MRLGRLPLKISTRIFLSFGIVFAVAALVMVIAVRDELRRQALAEAESKARLILDQKLAIHEYIAGEFYPKLKTWSESFGADNFFEPTWMSSTYVIQGIDQYFRALSQNHYYEKNCAVGARNPENEANDYERRFIEELSRDPKLRTQSMVAVRDGQPYFIILHRGLAMEAQCMECHSTPERAPLDLLEMYGSERGFHRPVGRWVSAISIRVPLNEAYAAADRFTMRLSALCLSVLGCLFLALHLLVKRLFLSPLGKVHEQALLLADSDEHLGETITPSTGTELTELTEAFNRMSLSLRVRVSEREAAEAELQKAQALLEARVVERTAELSKAYEQLKLEVQEKNRVQDDLIHQRDFIESLINTAQAIILVLDNLGRVVRFNPYLERLSGYTLAEARGRDWFQLFVPPDCRESAKTRFAEFFAGNRFGEAIIPILTKSGRERQIAWSSEELRRTDGSSIGMLSVGRDITERKRAEEALKRSEIRLRGLYSQLLREQEEEKRKISKEVHDSIGSPLAGIKIGLENAVMQNGKGRIEPEALSALADLAQNTMRECRRIMTDLRPPVLDDYGIVVAIKWLCERVQMINPGILIESRIEVSEAEVPGSLRIVLFRIVQEALNNAARHSGAKSVSVSMLRGERIELCVRDDGHGFDMKSVLSRKEYEGGFGISNMKERAELSGGTFRIETGAETGTTVCAEWSL